MAEPTQWALETAADFLWPRYYANDEGNTTTRNELIADDASCLALATILDAARQQGYREGLARAASWHDEKASTARSDIAFWGRPPRAAGVPRGGNEGSDKMSEKIKSS